MFEQLQTMTLSLCHFAVYQTPDCAHKSTFTPVPANI